MIRYLKSGIATLVFLFVITFAMAQPGDPPPPDIPIDGGAGFLIAAGMMLGIKKIYDIYKPGSKE